MVSNKTTQNKAKEELTNLMTEFDALCKELNSNQSKEKDIYTLNQLIDLNKDFMSCFQKEAQNNQKLNDFLRLLNLP